MMIAPIERIIQNIRSARFTRRELCLRLGNTVEAEIIVNKKEDTLYVPIEAVFEKNGASYVYLYKDKKLVEMPVTTGISTIESLEILSGDIQPGQIIAIPKDDMKTSR